MKNISFADNQLQELIEYYNKEREKAWKRFEETTSILERLTTSFKTTDDAFSQKGRFSTNGLSAKRGRNSNAEEVVYSNNIEVPAKKRGRKPGSTNSNKSLLSKTKSKRASNERKSKWGSFIVGTLKSKKQPLQVTQIAEIALLKKKYPADDYDKVKAAIAGGLHRLTNVNKRLIPLSVPGERGSFYSLTEWLDTNNQLKEKFNKLPAEVAEE